MEVLCHGIQKSGTHALVKAVQLLGVPQTTHAHLPFSADRLPDLPKKRIYIHRNLRDCLVSYVRQVKGVVTQGYLIGAIKLFDHGMSIHGVKNSYEGWLSDPGTLVVRFEKLLKDEGEFRKIARYLGVAYLEDAFENLPGGTQTWNAVPSNWRDHWTTEVEKAWQDSKKEKSWSY